MTLFFNNHSKLQWCQTYGSNAQSLRLQLLQCLSGHMLKHLGARQPACIYNHSVCFNSPHLPISPQSLAFWSSCTPLPPIPAAPHCSQLTFAFFLPLLMRHAQRPHSLVAVLQSTRCCLGWVHLINSGSKKTAKVSWGWWGTAGVGSGGGVQGSQKARDGGGDRWVGRVGPEVSVTGQEKHEVLT